MYTINYDDNYYSLTDSNHSTIIQTTIKIIIEQSLVRISSYPFSEGALAFVFCGTGEEPAKNVHYRIYRVLTLEVL